MKSPWVFGINHRWYVNLEEVLYADFSEEGVILGFGNAFIVFIVESSRIRDERLISIKDFDFLKRYFGVDKDA